jgi:type I restriction enzyme S subunit
MNGLPGTWRVVPLGEVADTTLGKMLDRGKIRGLPSVPYLRNVNVQWGRIDTQDLLTMELADGDRDRFAVQPGDLLVCEGGEIGRAAIWNGRTEYLAFQKALHRIRSRGNLDLFFLRYLLELYRDDGTLERFATGSTIAHLPQQKLRALPVPLPTLDEQRRIVDILEDHLSRLDAAASSVEAADRRLIALRRSTLNALYSRSDNPRVPLRDLVGGIEAGRSFGGSSHPASDNEWGIIKVSAMTWGTFRANENKAIASDRAEPRYEIKTGDLLLSRANTTSYVGASVLVGEVRPRLLLSDKSLRILAAPDVEREWLWRALSAPDARSQMSAAATGTKDSMRNISQSALLNIELSAVPVADQKVAVAVSLEVETGIQRLTVDLASAAVRCERLRHALLGAAFSGRLTGRPTDMEMVEEMAGV